MENLHTSESTSYSLTNTVADRPQDGGRLNLPSTFSSPAVKSISPKRLPSELHTRPHPQRSVSLDPRIAPPIIPPTHANRTLVLCFDGTGDQFDADNSNIVQLVSLLKKDDRSKQMVYYQSGIGTYTTPQVANPLSAKIAMTLDVMLAWNLDAHVMSGYEFLMQTYVAGDRICLFGFSRGAYTARSLAGMLQKVGLLPSNNVQQVPFAYKMYTQADRVGWEQSAAFKKAFSIDVDIEFIGVWDTVDAVGLTPKRLPFTTSNTIVRTFRHALSLDERRAKFKANMWNRPNSHEESLSDMQLPESPLVKIRASPLLDPEDADPDKKHKRSSGEERDEDILRHFEQLYAEKETHPTDVEEVWFSGCHCDVGGGSVSNKTRNSLARIPLRWMIRECFKTNTGLMFECKGLRELGLDPSTLHPFVTPRPPPIPVGNATIENLPPKPRSGIRRRIPLLRKNPPPDRISARVNGTETYRRPVRSEEEEDFYDVLSPVYDQLKLQRAWWILEVIPQRSRFQEADNSWLSYVRSNWGRPRSIPLQQEGGVKIHRSVKTRMDAHYPPESRKKKKYSPRAEIYVEPTWID